MKNRFDTLIRKYSKKQLIILIVGLVVVVYIGSKIYGGSRNITFIPVERGLIEEEVLVTGKTESKTEVNLGFQTSGKVVIGSPDVGSVVSEGEVLARLDQSDLMAKIMKIDANINQAQVELDSTKRKSVLSNQSAVNGLVTALKESYVKSDSAVRNNTDQFFINLTTSAIDFKPSFIDNGVTYYDSISRDLRERIVNSRIKVQTLLTDWQKSQSKIDTNSDLVPQIKLAQDNLNQIKTYLDLVSIAINSLSLSGQSDGYAKYNSTIDVYKTSISSARNSILTTISNLITAEEKYNNAPQANNSNQVFDDVLVSQAKLDSFKADRALIEADLAKTVLHSPISGVVTKSEAKRGEIVTAGNSLITVMSENKLQIKADVSEINISKVRVGNSVSITFDTDLSKTYQGKISYIDPASILVDGVATYKVTVDFDNIEQIKDNPIIRNGLTANLRIQTQKREDVLRIPAYALEKKAEKVFVQVLENNKVKPREILIGLKGKDGFVEVISGLNEGDQVEIVTNQ